jgi:hypothetical protein
MPCIGQKWRRHRCRTRSRHCNRWHDWLSPAVITKATTYVVRTLSLSEVVTGMPHEKQSLTVMPGLGKSPAFMNVDIDAEGRTSVCSRL